MFVRNRNGRIFPFPRFRRGHRALVAYYYARIPRPWVGYGSTVQCPSNTTDSTTSAYTDNKVIHPLVE